MELLNKTAVVTGASDGVGREVVFRLAKEGVNFALLGRNKERLDDVVKKASELGSSRTIGYTCDLQEVEQIDRVIKKAASDFGEIHMLINMAGVWQKLSYPDEIAYEEIERVIRTNLISLMQITKVTIPYLKQQSDAAIINMSSRSGFQALPGQAAYSASKWGVRGFTDVLKEDLKDTNIRVAGIYPAGINTRILEKAGDHISTREYSDPKDIAEVVCFMLSQHAKIWLHDVRITY